MIRCALLVVLALAAAPPALQAAETEWSGFQIILWHNHGPAALAGARRLGVTAGMVLGERGEALDPAVLRQRAVPFGAAGLGFYVENIATDFYAPYHRWQPDRPVTWLFDQVRALRRRDPADPAAFRRSPGLSDPAWLARITLRLAVHVRALAPFRPLYYSLGDETGIADLAAAWDFDFSGESLAGMRAWLRTQYGSLAALNRAWGSDFATWDAVAPITTDAALARHDDNFAAWADFKAWMDVAFARALRAGTEAVHRADPTARAAIEGAQAPGWGGYDYTLLAGAVDVMEVYDIGNSVEIAHALNPDLVLLTTSGAAGPRETWRLWHAALLGVRGVILWDPDGAVVGPDGIPGPRGAALAPLFAALRGAATARLAAGAPAADPVGILYSPLSWRLRWLLDRANEATDWTARDAATEAADDNAARRAIGQAARVLAHRGLAPRWLAPAMLTEGGLAGLHVLVLPQVLALSDEAAAAIDRFAAAGGTVLADIPPGAFDGHGRRRPFLPLAGRVRLLPGLSEQALLAALAAAGVTPGFTLTRPDGTAVHDVEARLRREEGGILLGLLRDPPAAGEAFDAEEVVLTLQRPARLRDLLGTAPARVAMRQALRLEATRPALLEVAPAR